MSDTSGGGEPSGVNDLSGLIRTLRNEFSLQNPEDLRWPCPFCFHKSKTVVQCHVHVSRVHPSLYIAGRSGQHSLNVTMAEHQSINDALDPLDVTDYSYDEATRGAGTIVCKRCTQQVKVCKGLNGLKVHYARAHRDFMSDFVQRQSATTPTVSAESDQPSQSQRRQLETKAFRCRFANCSKSFDTPNGLKIHIAKCHKDSQPESSESDFAKLVQSFKSGVKVIRRIPRGARISVAVKLTSLINDCISINSTDVWQSLFLFAYRVLSIKRTNSKQKSLTKTIKENASKESVDVIPEKRISVSLKKIIESKVADGDVRGAIRILSSADSIAPENDETFEILKTKHPIPSSTTNKPNAPTGILPLIVSEEQVKNSVFSFASGSASGIDGLLPQHLKDLLSTNSGEAGKQLLTSLTKLSNFMLSGKVCQEFVPYLYGASLIAFNKKDGGIRPIAIGATIRRLVSKLCCSSISVDLVPILQPKQIGFGVKGGSEAAIHSVRTFIHKNKSAEIIIKVDVSNAFNTLDRVFFLSEIEKKLPGIYPYVYQCYASPTSLFYNKSIISSSTGVQQGDPLGSAIFSLGINNIIQSLITDLNLWYLDDGTLGGKAETVIKDLITLQERFTSIGLNLNPSKCEAFVLPHVPAERKREILTQLNFVAPGMSTVSESDLCLLGAPVLESAIEAEFEKKHETMEFFMKTLQDVQSHIALYLIQHSLWMPRLAHFIRCTPTFKFKSLLANMDTEIRIALETILNLKFTEESWLQCSMPVKFGGIGIRSCDDLALPSFLSSVYSTKSLIGSILNNNDAEITYVEEAFSEWKSLSLSVAAPAHPERQSNWDSPLIERKMENIPKNSPEDVARFLALSRPESGAWLHALPSKNLGTVLDDTSLRIAVLLRVGGSICKQFECRCGVTMSTNAIHGLSCNKSTGRYGRHAALNAIIKRALSTAGFSSILEPPGLVREDGKCADGMTIFPWRRGRSLVWDATCIDTMAPTYVMRSSKEVASAANHAETKKIDKYKTIIINHEFVGFAVETLGPFSDGARRLVDDLGKLLISASGDPRSKSFLIQRIGIEIQRGNSASILGTVPYGESLSEIFYL